MTLIVILWSRPNEHAVPRLLILFPLASQYALQHSSFSAKFPTNCYMNHWPRAWYVNKSSDRRILWTYKRPHFLAKCSVS